MDPWPKIRARFNGARVQATIEHLGETFAVVVDRDNAGKTVRGCWATLHNGAPVTATVRSAPNAQAAADMFRKLLAGYSDRERFLAAIVEVKNDLEQRA